MGCQQPLSGSQLNRPELTDPRCKLSGRLFGNLSQTFQGGEARFEDLYVNTRRADYFLSFSAHALNTWTSRLFGVQTGAAYALFIAEQPSNTVAGFVLLTQPLVLVRDRGNNTVLTEVFVNASLIPGESAVRAPYLGLDVSYLTGTTRFLTADGVAAYADLVIHRALPLSDTFLRFESAGLIGVSSRALTVVYGVGAYLTMDTQPGNGTGGEPLARQPVVAVVDTGGNTVLNANATVKAWVFANGSVVPSAGLRGRVEIEVENGVAVFTDLSVDVQSQAFALLFTATDDTTLSSTLSARFRVSVGPAHHVSVETAPDALQYGGALLAPAPVVCIVDRGGNVVPESTGQLIALLNCSITAPGETLRGTTVVAMLGGCSEFAAIAIDTAPSACQITFSTSTSIAEPEATTDVIAVAIGNASLLSILALSDHAMAAEPLEEQPLVHVTDLGGNRVQNATGTMFVAASRVLARGNQTESLRINGTLSASVILGVAQFTDLALLDREPQTILTFQFDNLSLASFPINVSAGPPFEIVVITQPGDALGGEAMSAQPAVEVLDKGGNRVWIGGEISMELMGGNAMAQLGSVTCLWYEQCPKSTQAVIRGLANFTDLAVDLEGQNYFLDLAFSRNADTFQTRSGLFNVSIGTPYAFGARENATATSPTSKLILAGEGFTGLVLSVDDRGGNVVPNASGNATAELWVGRNEEQVFYCNGSSACSVEVAPSVGDDEMVVEAKVSVEVVCTDFDYASEYIASLVLDGIDVAQLRKPEFDPGPWDRCYGSCLRKELVLDALSVTELVQNRSFALSLTASPQVNLYGCQGHILNAIVSLQLSIASRLLPASELSSPSSIAVSSATDLSSSISILVSLNLPDKCFCIPSVRH